MAKSTPAHITPSVLKWARDSAGYTRRQAADAIHAFEYEVELAETGDHELTLRQAETLARLYDRQLATLFLAEPPAEESLDALFRRLPGTPPPPWPPELRKLARRIRDRQEAAAEIYDLLDEDPPWIEARARLTADRPHAASSARAVLGITLEEQYSWNDSRGYAPLRSWVDAVEALGILVMQDGSLALEQLRGFASLDDLVPAILVNTKDDPRARTFTVIHELGHVIDPTATERWCDNFAGEVLIPRDALADVVMAQTKPPEQWLGNVALRFGVTAYAMAVRIAHADLLPTRAARNLMSLARSRGSSPRPPGGNYFRNKVTWLGPSYVRLVMNAVDDQALTLSNAAGLLEAKVDHFADIRRTVEERAEFG